MTDLKHYISQFGNPNAIIDFNGNHGITASIWDFESVIECINGSVFLNGTLQNGEPLELLQETLNTWNKSSIDISAVGFISYDFKNILFPHIKFKSITNNIPQYWFGKPKKVKILNDLFILKPFKSSSLSNIYTCISENKYYQSINKIKHHIEYGDVYQINKTYPIQFELEGTPFNLYSQMSWKIKPRRGFYLDIGKKQFLSFSPEEFIKVKNDNISTFPMKGTRPEGENDIERSQNIKELSNSKKDKAEHLMIVDLLRNDLGKICNYGTVKTNNLYGIQTYETIHHMVSEVSGKLKKEINFTQIIKALFPGGSITGAPKEKVMEIIDKLEQYNRGIYTGTMGYIKPNGDMDFNIAIRTITIENKNVEYPVGGGIVWDSNPVEEWAETKTKSKILDYVISELGISC